MNKKTLKLVVLCTEIVLAVVIFIMMFLSASEIKTLLVTKSFNTFQTAFGYSESNGTISVKVLDFNFGNFLTFVFFLVAVGTCCAKVLFKKSSIGKLLGFVSAVLFILAGVFFFLNSVFMGDGYSLGIGAILAGIFSIFAGLVVCCDVLVLKD